MPCTKRWKIAPRLPSFSREFGNFTREPPGRWREVHAERNGLRVRDVGRVAEELAEYELRERRALRELVDRERQRAERVGKGREPESRRARSRRRPALRGWVYAGLARDGPVAWEPERRSSVAECGRLRVEHRRQLAGVRTDWAGRAGAVAVHVDLARLIRGPIRAVQDRDVHVRRDGRVVVRVVLVRKARRDRQRRRRIDRRRVPANHAGLRPGRRNLGKIAGDAHESRVRRHRARRIGRVELHVLDHRGGSQVDMQDGLRDRAGSNVDQLRDGEPVAAFLHERHWSCDQFDPAAFGSRESRGCERRHRNDRPDRKCDQRLVRPLHSVLPDIRRHDDSGRFRYVVQGFAREHRSQRRR